MAIPATIALMALLLILRFRKRIERSTLLGILVFLTFYIVVVCAALFQDLYLEWRLQQMDLNQDGLLSGSELTQEQDELMTRVTNDVGRNLAFVTAGIYGLVLGLAVFSASILRRRFRG